MNLFVRGNHSVKIEHWKFQILIIKVRFIINQILEIFLKGLHRIYCGFIFTVSSSITSLRCFFFSLLFCFLILRFVIHCLIVCLSSSVGLRRNWNRRLSIFLWFLTIIIENLSCGTGISKGFSITDLVNDLLLLFSKRDINKVSNLEEQVCPISKIHLINFFIRNLEEVIIVEFPIPTKECFCQTQILTLDEFLNASIFGHIDELVWNALWWVLIRREECMTNLMSNQ